MRKTLAIWFAVTAFCAMVLIAQTRADYRIDTAAGTFTTLKSNVVGGVSTPHVLPFGGVAVTGASANVANAAAVATLTATASTTAYITGFQCTASGATAALVVTATVVGTITGTMRYTFTAPAGAAVAAQPLIVTFGSPVPASAVNTNIVVTLPALGAGNTNATCSAQGFLL